MGKQRETRMPRTMKQVLLVVCEGETEEAYIDLLRQRYRMPIKIVPKVAGEGLTKKKLDAYRNEQKIHGSELIRTFLMYDMDVESVVEKLKGLDAVLLLSNPCIELWFLLHSADCRSELETAECEKRLKAADAVWKNYEKSKLTIAQRDILWHNRGIATSRAMALGKEQNPSSSVYEFLMFLDTIKQG